jgi:alpha-glucosidase
MVGTYRPVRADEDVLAYEREHEDERFLIALNFGPSEARLPLDGRTGRIELSTCLDRAEDRVSKELVLRGNEGVVMRLASH